MALIDRISQLFKADVHAVLDRIEEPELLLKQAIRDMQDELNATERRIEQRAHEQDALDARKRELAAAADGIQAQLDLCFESDKTDLARSQIRKRLEIERLLKRLISRHEANETYLDDQRRQLKDNRTTLESLRQKAELFANQPPPSYGEQADGAEHAHHDFVISDEEVEIELLREQSVRRAS